MKYKILTFQKSDSNSKTIWFREEIVNTENIYKIDTVEQLVDISTKLLTRVTFEYLQKMFMRW